MPEVKLEEQSLLELKGLVYDFSVQKDEIERSALFQQYRDLIFNIQTVNNEIQVRVRLENETKKVEENHTQELVTN